MPFIFLKESDLSFPHHSKAAPDGMLAIGGDLSVPRLLEAYKRGIFPWFNEDDPPLWWCPDPRCVIFPKEIKVSKTMRQLFTRQHFKVTYDQAFDVIIACCQNTKRKGQHDTWITVEFIKAYTELHKMGLVHSVEVWHEDKIVGGLYGVSLGRSFFGESMFSRMPNASKFALISLAQDLDRLGFDLIDCQMPTEHLFSMGAREIPREEFMQILEESIQKEGIAGSWEGLR